MTTDLRLLFDEYPARFRPIAPPECLGNAGGLSGARLWKYRSAAGPMVARAWPIESTGESLSRIHGWLAEIRDLGYAATPVPGLDGRTLRPFAGRWWEVADWKPGAADLGRPPRPGHLRAGVSALATIHRRLAHLGSTGPSPGLSARLREIEDLRLGGFGVLERAILAAPASEEKDLALYWVSSASGLAGWVAGTVRALAMRPVPVQPCLRDVRPDHFLFEVGRLSGLVDFGAMGVESVSADLARLLSEWVGTDPSVRADAVDAYDEIRPLDRSEIEMIAAFEASAALLIGGHWARWHFAEHRPFERPSAALEGLRRGADRLGDLLIVGGRG